MKCLPTICDACSRVRLVAVPEAAPATISCERCGHVARIVPSRSYREEDAPRFAELSDVVTDGAPSTLEVASLKQALQQAVPSGYGALFDLLSSRFPELISAQLSCRGQRDAQRNVLGMLLTIFEALATRRSSGTMPAVAELPERLAKLSS